jgi:GDP-L-fucose synthase
LYASDAAHGLVLAAQRYDGAEPVNLGSGDEISIRDLVQTIADLCEFEGEVVFDALKPNGQPRRKLDVTRALDSFGFTSSTSLADGLRETINWYRAAIEETRFSIAR